MPIDVGLSDLLPVGDPFADFDPSPFQVGDRVASVSPAVESHGVLPQYESVHLGIAGASAVSFDVPSRTVKRSGKRRRSWSGVLLVGTVVCLFAGLVGCLILLVNGKAFTTDGELVALEQMGGKPKIIADGDGVESKPVRDPVMGILDKPRDSAIDPSKRRQGMLDPNLLPGGGVAPMELGADEPMPEGDGGMEESPSPSLPAGETPAVPESAPSTPAPSPDATVPSDPKPEEAMDPVSTDANLEKPEIGSEMKEGSDQPVGELSPDMGLPDEPSGEESMLSAEQWQEGLSKVGELLLSGAFNEAQLRCEALPVGATPEEEQLRRGYGRLAELAEYYAEGIRSGSEKLKVAETFNLPGGVTVAVVEASRKSISLKIDGRVRRYAIEDLPLVLANQLASFALPVEEPVVQAGQAAFNALWAHASGEHREQAMEMFHELHTRDNKLDADAMAAALKHLIETSGVQ